MSTEMDEIRAAATGVQKGMMEASSKMRSMSTSVVEAQSVLNDSGKRENFSTGASREPATGKGRYDLIPPAMLSRLAIHYENGAVKYAERNWEKGLLASRCFSSAIRHLFQWMSGMTNEDHLAAAIWNISALIQWEDVKPEMMDIQSREQYLDFMRANPELFAEEDEGGR